MRLHCWYPLTIYLHSITDHHFRNGGTSLGDLHRAHEVRVQLFLCVWETKGGLQRDCHHDNTVSEFLLCMVMCSVGV